MDPAPTISAFIRLPIPPVEEVAGTWTLTETKSGMVVRMIDVFVPSDKRETCPLPVIGMVGAKTRSVFSDRVQANGFSISMATASGTV